MTDSNADDGGTDVRQLDRPRADPSSRYHAALKKSAEQFPLVTDALMRADRHRLRRWQQFIDPVDLQALELLLDFLMYASRTFEGSSETAEIAFLPARMADDARMSLESLLSGYLQLASDAMRDVLETELLVRDFVLDTAQIRRWCRADEDVLRKKFRPVHSRQRLANALGVDVKDVPGATDYEMHSKLLHVRPPLLPALSPVSGHEATHVLNAISDIMFHGASSVRAVTDLLNATGHEIHDPEATLAALNDASEDLDAALGATEAMAQLAANAISTTEHLRVWIFESGLVVSVNLDTKEPAFYALSRTDFRHLHREVSPEHPVSFELESLGDIES